MQKVSKTADVYWISYCEPDQINSLNLASLLVGGSFGTVNFVSCKVIYYEMKMSVDSPDATG